MLKCSDGTLYTGWTNDLEKRVEAHNSGKGAKYTKARRPVELAYYEEFETKEQAMKREYAIKQLGRKEKQKLIAGKKLNYQMKEKRKKIKNLPIRKCYIPDGQVYHSRSNRIC